MRHRRIILLLLGLVSMLSVSAENVDYQNDGTYIELRETMRRYFNEADSAHFFPALQKLEDYLLEWLESYRVNIAHNTYTDYERYIRKRMIPFFQPMELKVKEVTGDEINAFYQAILKSGLKGSTVQRYHAVLHLAFKSAVKRKIIPTNPVDQADRPKSQQFIGSYYNADEIKHLLEVAKGDELYVVILLAAYYGLRRSEVLGLK